MSTVYPLMGMVGAKEAIIGNNPVAFAVPTGRDYPFLFDISLSKVAQGNLIQAKQKGQKIPDDWAADAEGNVTEDPEEGLKGFVLPVGGHKGFGLALMVEIFCGVLSGGAFLRNMRSMYKHPDEESGVCHLMAAIDISAFMQRERFYERMKEFTEAITGTEVSSHQDEIRLPGYGAYLCKQERLKKGIPLAKTLYDSLCDLSKKLGVRRP
jgi:LDH2 family malate/lactate/ureidoglycolate dehydrogenase